MTSRDLDRMLSRLVAEIERIETTRQRFGDVMRRIKWDVDLSRFPAVVADLVGTEFVKQIKPVSLAGLSIAGVDGGLVRRSFRSMNIVLTRGVAVVFRFRHDGPVVDFYPDPFPEPNAEFMGVTYTGIELDQLATLQRISTELKVALSVLDEFHSDIMLMDGSLFFHPRDRPPSSSAAFEKFQEVLALYRQLYNKVRKKRTVLVGIVKDSRSTRLVNMLGDILPHLLRDQKLFEMMRGVDYRWLLRVSRDCDILDTFLDEGERTAVFRYASELVQTHNSMDDLAKWANAIWVTYVKTARDDLPLRVEILADEAGSMETIDKTLAALLPLSSHHPEYGIPTPILEADARARITNKETQLIMDRLMALSGLTYVSLEKRRSRNPFGGG